MRKGTDLRYIHKDHLSGKSLVTSDNGSQVGTIKYYPYGATRAGSVPTDKKFTGQRLDDTGLYYYNARYYDPTIGRFISADIIVQNPANPQSLNRYSYVFNNPLRYTDPSELIVEFEDEEYILDMLEYDYDIPDDSPLGQEIQEWVESRLVWAEFEEEAPGIAEMLEESESVFTFSGVIPGQSGRSVLETVGQVVFDAVGQKHTAVNTLLGLKLATMSNSASLRFGPGGTLVFEGIDTNSTTGKLMDNVLGHPAFTVGYVILTSDPQISVGTLEHELGHVTQYAILGPAFLPVYIPLSILGHDRNPLETKWLPSWPRR